MDAKEAYFNLLLETQAMAATVENLNQSFAEAASPENSAMKRQLEHEIKEWKHKTQEAER